MPSLFAPARTLYVWFATRGDSVTWYGVALSYVRSPPTDAIPQSAQLELTGPPGEATVHVTTAFEDVIEETTTSETVRASPAGSPGMGVGCGKELPGSPGGGGFGSPSSSSPPPPATRVPRESCPRRKSSRPATRGVGADSAAASTPRSCWG